MSSVAFRQSVRAIGRGGTLARIAVSIWLLWLAVGDGAFTWLIAVLGLVVFPAVLLLMQVLRSRVSSAPLRATGPVGHAVNAAIIVALFLLPFPREVRDAVALFYGASMLVATWRGYAGCEVLAISNWLLRRDDQVGCVVFAPIDALEARQTTHATR